MKHVAFSRIGRAASAALVTKTIYAQRHDGMKC